MERIFETIRKYHMIEAGMRVIAGVSGGADSVCLLLALCRYREQVPFDITVVHVEHGIRGKESLEDAAFVKKLCEERGVPFRMEQVQAEQAARQRKMTVEEAGRALRYEVFERLRSELGANRIAVAHHMGDQAETVLWNLVRGSGVKGLGGIRPVRGAIIRPMLFLERSEIEEILNREGVSWRTDRTNLEPDYTRNRIRLQILPALERELNPGAVRHISEAALRMRKMQEYLDGETDRAAVRCIREDRGEVFLSLPLFRGYPELIRQELLKRCLILCRRGKGLKDVGAVHLDALMALAEMDCGKEYHLPGEIRAVREGTALRFHRKGRERISQDEPFGEVPFSIPGTLRVGKYLAHGEILENSPELMAAVCRPQSAGCGADRKNIEEKKYTKCMSYDTIYSNVCFRTRRPGDYLVVNQQGGRKKLKDYMIDEKIPKDQRDHVLLLASGSHILWIVGWRISEAVKVRQETRYILKIQMEEE